MDDTHDVALLHDQKILTVDLDFGTGPLSEEHDVADFDVDLNELSALVAPAKPNSNHFSLLWLFLHSIGNNDPALGPVFAFEAPDCDAIVQRSKCHVRSAFQAGHAWVPVSSMWGRWHSIDRSAKR